MAESLIEEIRNAQAEAIGLEARLVAQDVRFRGLLLAALPHVEAAGAWGLASDIEKELADERAR